MLLTVLPCTSAFAAESSTERLNKANSIIEKHLKGNTSREQLISEMQKNGFILISQEQQKESVSGNISVQSSEDQCIDLPTADIYRDVNNPSQYIASAFFNWNNHLWQADITSSGHVGGKDCFGMSFSRPVNILAKSFQTWDRNNILKINSSIADYQNNNGVCFKKYDDCEFTASPAQWNYFWDCGFITVTFTPQSTGTYAIWQTMGHTWNTTDISGVALGSGGINISFNKTNSKWSAVAPRSATYTW